MFKFRLQAVLDHRKRQEEEKQRELALVNRELLKVREALDALIAGREEGAQKLTELDRTATDVRTLKLYEDFLDGRDMDIAWKQKEVANVMERLRLKQVELQEYLKRRRIMEIYRDRLREAYDKEEKRLERIQADEVAGQMWFRQGEA